jgi:hypothetical protein
MCELGRELQQYLRNLNFFPSVPPSTDEYELQTQRISTRLFIIILSASLTILLLYTSLDKVTKMISVEEPTLTNYSQLYSTYSTALTCPCSKISVDYGKILDVNYTLHQVCSSIFVHRTWLKYLQYMIVDNPLSKYVSNTLIKIFVQDICLGFTSGWLPTDKYLFISSSESIL